MDVPVENLVNMATESSSAATTDLDWEAIYGVCTIIFLFVWSIAAMFFFDFLAMMLGFTKNGVKPGSLAAALAGFEAWQCPKAELLRRYAERRQAVLEEHSVNEALVRPTGAHLWVVAGVSEPRLRG
ncbi:hypothetical protein MTO96_003328 [Rhipicephalus appendiculatus]